MIDLWSLITKRNYDFKDLVIEENCFLRPVLLWWWWWWWWWWWNSSLKRPGMACVNEGSHEFTTCHQHVYPWMQWAILPWLPSRRESPHFGPVLISRPTESRRLSWPGWLVKFRDDGTPTREGRTLRSLEADVFSSVDQQRIRADETNTEEQCRGWLSRRWPLV